MLLLGTYNVVYCKTVLRGTRGQRVIKTDSKQSLGQEQPELSSRILITAGSSTSRRLIFSTVGFIGITDADKVIAQGEIKHFKSMKRDTTSSSRQGCLMFVILY